MNHHREGTKAWNMPAKKYLVCLLCFLMGSVSLSRAAHHIPASMIVQEENVKSRLPEALELFEQHDYAGAVERFEALQAQESEFSDYISFFLLRTYIKSENYVEALTLSQLFLRQCPLHPLTHEVALLEASALMKLERFQDALVRYQKLLGQKKISEARILYPLGEALLALGKTEDAADAFQRFLQGYPAHADAKAARDSLHNIVSSEPELQQVWTEDTLLTYAGTLMSSGLSASAIVQYKRFQADYPDSARFGESELGLATARLRVGNVKEGKRLLEEIARTYASSRPEIAAEAIYILGRQAWYADRNQDAKRRMQHIMTDFRTSAWGDDASYVLGRIYQSKQSFQAAAQCYHSLAARYAESPFVEEALFRAGWSFYLGQNYSKARRLFREATETFPAGTYSDAGHFWLGKSLEAAQEPEAAAEAYRSVVHKFSGSYYAVLANTRLQALTGRISIRQGAQGIVPAFDTVLADLRSHVSRKLYEEVLAHSRKAFALHRFELSSYAEGEIEWIAKLLEKHNAPAGDRRWEALRLYFEARLYQEIDEYLPAIRAGFRINNLARKGMLADFPYTVEFLQFPLRYQELIRKYAAKRRLDPYLVAGLIRQESAYAANAISRAGARGLMQIMPATGTRVARWLGLTQYSTAKLFDPEVNIAIGTAYLARMIEEFDGNLFRAVAAYNAGPRVTNKWWTAENADQEEEVVENISYTETRNYVKYVLRNSEQYRRLYPDLDSSQ
ncbi:hypothetical protein CSB45_06425 [candidate division KSB3 bacterium]|uniref:Transglycosylase SLT domain-containing protein n=1 Tax=candidate division KSB3 bacterium TaxID=2044937 RepID=A0A2G6E6X9_9BACT|nr:MAG: hypothetical protein CSB45_06425 [candidate division KSB3 bacterium]PIE30276.1 MAG: hypothetical protein CSA57_05140 [candidate division KSB3 bacterium]